MIIRIFLLVCVMFSINSAHAQKVKLKNDVIYVDGEAAFSYARKMNKTELVVYNLNTKDELFTAIFYPVNIKIHEDNYYKIVFAHESESMEYTRVYWNKSLISWMLEQDVLTGEGKINTDKIDSFITKYDENVSERTMILR